MSNDRLNILLIEDNEDDYVIVRDLLCDIDPQKFILEWASSYEDGLKAVLAVRHDLILLDFRLSYHTGLELLQETRSVSSRAPVIFMTGQGDYETDVQAMQSGAADYLVKDRLAAETLERAIRYAVGRQKSAVALQVSEDRYRAFIENSTEGIWRFELEPPLSMDWPEKEQIAHLSRYAKVAECNDIGALMYGFGCGADVIGTSLGHLFSLGGVGYGECLSDFVSAGYRSVNCEAFATDRYGNPRYISHTLNGVLENGFLQRVWGTLRDITERKSAETAQAELAAIIASSEAAIISFTLDGLVVTWNKGAEEQYGYRASEIIGQSIGVLIPSDRDDELRPVLHEDLGFILNHVRRGESVPAFETTRICKGGVRIDISDAISPIVNAMGRVTGGSSVSHDISARKKTERMLQTSEANMAAAQRIAHFGSWEMDLDDQDDFRANPQCWSDEMFRIFGYEPGTVPVTSELLYGAVPPEEHLIIRQAIATAVAQRSHASIVHRIRRSDGEERIVRQTAQFFEGETPDQPASLVGTMHDITDQRQAEEHIRFQALLLSQVRNAVVATDIAGQIIYWNSFAETLYQWKSEEVLGRNIAEVSSLPEDQVAAEQVMSEIRETGSWQGEWRARRKDGSTFTAFVVDSLFRDTNGNVIGIVGVSIDITERQQAEEALRQKDALIRIAGRVTHTGGWALEMTNQRVFWSDEVCNILEYSHDYMPSLAEALACYPDPWRDKISAALEVSARDGVPFDIEAEVVTFKGRRLWVRVCGEVESHPDGSLKRVQGAFQDITGRKRADVLLTESRQRLALATESARIGIWDWDVAANEMLWDPQMYALYGIREQDFSGAYGAWENGLHPEDRDRGEAEIASALDGSGEFHTQFRILWPSGEVRHIEAHATVQRAADGSALRMIGVNWDITERKLAEESMLLRDKAIQASRNGIVLADMRQPDCPIVSVNPAFEQMSGYSAAEILGRNCRFLQGADRDQPALESLRDAIKARLPIDVVLRNYRKDGTPFWNELSLSPIHDVAGVLTHYVGIQNDISERKQAEEERDRIEVSLRQSEKRYRGVVAKVESLVIHDQQGRLIDVNENACDSLGYTREEMLRLRVPDYEMKYEEANIAWLWEQMAAGEMSTLVVDGLHRRKDGSTFPVEVRAGLMETDGPLLMVAVARDVTDRKNAQDALREAEREQRQLAARLEVERARLAEAQEIAKVGSWELDLLADILTWSDENYRIFGTDRAIFGGNYQAFLDGLHPDDRAAVDTAYTTSVANRTPYAIDHRILGEDGSIKFVHELCQTFYDNAGRPIRSVGTTQDVTANHLMVEALRQSEHKFRSIIETTHEGVVQLDADAKIIYANQRYCNMLGYTAGELIGCDIFDLMDDESRVLARHSIEQRGAGMTEQFDRRYRHKNGTIVWAIVSASPIFNENDQVIGSFGMITDITERKHLEMQVRQSEKLAALGELVAGVAHEINNPMAAILGNAELLEMHSDPQVRQDAQAIQRMIQRVTRIVRSLLTFARPQKEERKEEALNALVEHTLEMTTHKLRAAGIALTLRLHEPSPAAFVNADEIQQILLNLILNAEHALRRAEGKKSLVVSTGTAQIDDREWATISVMDNGHGIPEDIRARIFDPFFTTKDVGEGTGLGLSICHGIAEAHKGRLSVESALGAGTTFTLLLPPFADYNDAPHLQNLLPGSLPSGKER